MNDIVGPITNPLPVEYQTVFSGGGLFITNVLRLFFVAAGIYALLNFLIGGFGFINAGGDSKAIEKAWAKIWQSLLGLVLIIGSFALAAIFGQLIFGDPTFILQPKIYGPGI
jgi:hypothetical protein